MSEYVRLVLLFPPRLEALVTEALTVEPRMPGFTLLHAEGHSSDFTHASAAEQVRGRVDTRVLWIVVSRDDVDLALHLLQGRVDSTEVRWWIEPVIAMGRLG